MTRASALVMMNGVGYIMEIGMPGYSAARKTRVVKPLVVPQAVSAS